MENIGILDGTLWEVIRIRTINVKDNKTYVYGIICPKVINPLTGLYDQDWIESQVGPTEVHRSMEKDSYGFRLDDLCFMSTKANVSHVTVVKNKLKLITI